MRRRALPDPSGTREEQVADGAFDEPPVHELGYLPCGEREAVEARRVEALLVQHLTRVRGPAAYWARPCRRLKLNLVAAGNH